jgi:hypothetical protein
MACWKIAYATKAEARKSTIVDRPGRTGIARLVVAYRCDDCNKFHVGHSPKSQKGLFKRQEARQSLPDIDHDNHI